MNENSTNEAPTEKTARADREDVKRVGALSDGVFAIAMTLLVLDLKSPEPGAIRSAANLRGMIDQWSNYEAYILSFVVIALYWEGHWQAFKRLITIDRTALWLNMALLMGIAFIPYPTSIISEFGQYPSGTILYAAVLSAIGFVWAGFWHYSQRNGLFERSSDPEDDSQIRYQLLLTPIVFALSILIALSSPGMAKYSWLLIFLGRFTYPTWRRITSRARKQSVSR